MIKGFLAFYFAVGVIFLSAQITHQTYYSWFWPAKSVLDRYTETKKETSMEELEKQYEEAHRKVKALEKNGIDPLDEDNRLYRREPYKSAIKLRDAIQVKEWDAKKKFMVNYYWLWGLGGLILGFICFRWIHEFLGLPFMIAGFTGMIVSTHDLHNYFGSDASIVTYKLKFALITLTLLIATAYLTGVFRKENDQENEQSMQST